MTWHDSNEFCRSKNSSLISIHDQKTNDLFAAFSPLNKSIPFVNYNYYWVGMNTMSENGLYEWSDGTKTEFTNFASNTIDGKVIHVDVYQPGKCVTMRSAVFRSIPIKQPVNDSAGLWYITDCGDGNGFICAKHFEIWKFFPNS
jgi:hypothetical protein